LRGGLPPLDYDTVSSRAETADWDGQTVCVTALSSIAGFKRLAARPQDRIDLAELEAIYGPSWVGSSGSPRAALVVVST
jgi:hypothetical protein